MMRFRMVAAWHQYMLPVWLSNQHGLPTLGKLFFRRGFCWRKIYHSFTIARSYVRDLTQEDLHVDVSESHVKSFLSQKAMKYEKGHTCLVLDCPVCLQRSSLVKYDRSASAYTISVPRMFINRTTGMYLCHSCKQSGTWKSFKHMISVLESERHKGILPKKTFESLSLQQDLFPSAEVLRNIALKYKEGICMSTIPPLQLRDILVELGLQRLKLETLMRYEAKLSPSLDGVMFPVRHLGSSLIGLYSVSRYNLGGTRTVKTELFPKNLSCTLFGYVKGCQRKHLNEVCLSSTPLEAMAIAQETSAHVVALVNNPPYLPPEILPLLEPYSKVILWLGNDIAAGEVARSFARKLGEKRCYIVRPLVDGLDQSASGKKVGLQELLKSAQPLAHKAITTFSAIRAEVFAEFMNAEQIAGLKWKRFPVLNRVLKGHRRGELTVFTGPTGSGKTTFISEYSLDLCMQGVPTLWGSFEINNVRLAKIMLSQFSLLPMDRNLDAFDHWADLFEKLNMYFLTFHGEECIQNVIKAMSHAVYMFDIQHVIVDNLQFMMGHSEVRKVDRYWKQDTIVSGLRRFATAHNCHVTLVIHPRKEISEELNTSSIFGTAKASQEADNVLILQDRNVNSLRGRRKYLEITKNRFDGGTGLMPLQFDKETLSFVPKPRPRRKIESVDCNEESNLPDDKT